MLLDFQMWRNVSAFVAFPILAYMSSSAFHIDNKNCIYEHNNYKVRHLTLTKKYPQNFCKKTIILILRYYQHLLFRIITPNRL